MTQLLDYLSEKYHPQSIDEINRRLVELSSLFEISQILNESLELDHILNNFLLIPMGRLMIARGAIFLRNNDEYRVQMSKGIPQEYSHETFPASETIPRKSCLISEILSNGKPAPNRKGKKQPLSKEERRQIAGHPLFSFAQKVRLEYCVPFVSKNRCIGVALFGPKLNNTKYSQEEIDFLNSLAGIATSSIENALQVEKIKEINKQLDERIQELRTLFDIAQGLSATLEHSKILRLLVYALMGQMLVTRYAILLARDKELYIQENKGFNEAVLESSLSKLSRANLPQQAILVSELKDASLSNSLRSDGIEVLVSMRHQNKQLGYIMLGSRINRQEFTENDLEFLSTLVNQAVISLENARLFQETLEKQRIEEELNVARTMQQRLLPKSLPPIAGYTIYGMNIPSRQVGGDYYDVIKIDEDRYALAIGDVSGKSVPAALLMANLQAALRVMIKQKIPLTEVVGNLNDLIFSNTDADKYITFFVGILDRRENRFHYVNAGHNPPLLCHPNGEIELLEEGGIILGMLSNFAYRSAEICFEPGDLFFGYTDGVNEAINLREEEFGEERLTEIVKTRRTDSPRTIADVMWQSILDFSQNQPQEDDVTMLILKRE